MTILTEQDIINAGRAIREVLPRCLPPESAQSLDRTLETLLDKASSHPTDTADAIEAEINQYPAVKLYFEEYLGLSGDRKLNSAQLPGDPTSLANFQLYACEHCDYLWLRKSRNQPIPTCPDHPDSRLKPYNPDKPKS